MEKPRLLASVKDIVSQVGELEKVVCPGSEKNQPKAEREEE